MGVSGSFVADNLQVGSAAASGFALGGPIGAGIGATVATVKVSIQELIQHSIRLKAAKNENAALDAMIPAFDADLKTIATAYQTGQISANEGIAAAQALDNQTFTYLYQHAFGATGQPVPGTAWTGPKTTDIGSSINPTYAAPCNKTCTAGCCVYLGSLRPAIYGRTGLPGDTYTGLIEVLSKGGGTVMVPRVNPPPNKAYGNFGRPAYTITITAPSLPRTVEASLTSSLNELFGTTPSALSGLPTVSAMPQSVSPTLLIVGFGLLFVGVLLAVFAGR